MILRIAKIIIASVMISMGISSCTKKDVAKELSDKNDVLTEKQSADNGMTYNPMNVFK